MIERISTKDLLVKSLKDLAKIKSIAKVTIKEITDNCGLSKRTFYQHFQDKGELILYEYTKNLSKIFSKKNKDLPCIELMHRAIMVIVNDYDYYKNAFTAFDYSTHIIHNMKLSSSSVFKDFIKFKFNIKELTEEELVALKIYTFGNWAFGMEWTKDNMPVSVEKLAQYYISSVPCILKKYLD